MTEMTPERLAEMVHSMLRQQITGQDGLARPITDGRYASIAVRFGDQVFQIKIEER